MGISIEFKCDRSVGGGGSRLIVGERSHYSRYVLTAKRDHERVLGAEAD